MTTLANNEKAASSQNARKMDIGDMQDLHHYALALMGKDNGVDAYGLMRRLEVVETIYRKLTTLHDDTELEEWDECAVEQSRINTVEELVALGEKLMAKVDEWGKTYKYNCYAGRPYAELHAVAACCAKLGVGSTASEGTVRVQTDDGEWLFGKDLNGVWGGDFVRSRQAVRAVEFDKIGADEWDAEEIARAIVKTVKGGK